MSSFTTSLIFWFLLPKSLIISCASNTFSLTLYLHKSRLGWRNIFSSTFVILLCTILEIILLIKQLKLMSLKSENFFTSSFLGSSTKLVWVINLGNSCPRKKALTNLVISAPITSQQLWKKTWKTIRSTSTLTV